MAQKEISISEKLRCLIYFLIAVKYNFAAQYCTMDKVNITRAKELINNATNIIITAHKNPDGDAIGSSLALWWYLKNSGKNATVVLPNRFPRFYNWMPGSESVVYFDEHKEKVNALLDSADLVFSLDYNTLSRTGDLAEPLENLNCPFILIDHHQQPDNFTVSFSDVNSCSTAEMIFQFCSAQESSDEWISTELSECVYTGIMTDTGSFRFPLASAETHEIIAKLKRKGLDHSRIHQNVYDTNLMDKLQLLGHALTNKLEMITDNSAMISVSKEELDRYNYKPGDTEGLVNYALSLSGVNLAVLVKEGNNIVKLSFRSKGSFNVNEFARKHFNGGGHNNAAGGASFLEFQETVSKIKSEIKLVASELNY